MIIKVGQAAVMAVEAWVIEAAPGQAPTSAGPAADSHLNKKRQFRFYFKLTYQVYRDRTMDNR